MTWSLPPLAEALLQELTRSPAGLPGKTPRLRVETHPIFRPTWQGLEVVFPSLRPFPIRLGFSGGEILFAEAFDPQGGSVYISREIRFNRRVSLGLLFWLERRFLKALLPHLAYTPRGADALLLEAEAEGAIRWHEASFHQRGKEGRERWILLRPGEKDTQVVVYEPQQPRVEAYRFRHQEVLLEWLSSLFVPPWTGIPREEGLPKGLELLWEGPEEEELQVLSTFSQALGKAYALLLFTYPWAGRFLPRYLPDGRTKPQVEVHPPSPPPDEDPLLAMAGYWDHLAWDLSWGRADLLPVAPAPIRVREGYLAFTPTWALLAEE